MKLKSKQPPKFSTALSICASAVLVGALCATPALAAPSDTANSARTKSANTAQNSTRAKSANSAQNAQAKNTKANSASAKNTKANSGRNATNSAKRKNVKSPPPTAKNSTQTRGKSKTYGLMPSTLDNQGHNVYHADSDAIRGARDTESALRYMPFVTIVNTAGFGQQFDLRGQGRLSAGGVKFLINGISFNPLDSYYGFMPINTVLPTLTHEISVSPSVGSRGGTITVITSQSFDKPYFSVGAGSARTLATTGTTFNAFAQAAENFSAIKLNAGVGYFSKGGPREDDSSTGGQAVLGALLNLGLGQSISVDADFYTAKDKTTPYNSFWDSERVAQIVRRVGVEAGRRPDESLDDALAPPQEQNALSQIQALQAFQPSKDDRKNKAQGEIESSHKRFAGSLGYQSEVTNKLKFDLTGFYAFDKREYDKYNSTTLLYRYGGRYFIGTDINPNSIDQSGSSFDEQKYGAKAQIDWLHTNGELVFAIESILEKAKRNPKQLLSTSKQDTASGTGQNISSNTRQWLEFDIATPLNISKWSNAVYFLENYKFSEQLSTALGVRYEMTKSKIDTTGQIEGQIFSGVMAVARTRIPLEKSLEANHDNFAVEVAPAYHYSDTGTLYGRYELGFSAVPSYAMLVRQGNLDLSQQGKISGGFTMNETNLDDETYNSFEIGFKDYVPNRQIRLGNFNLTIDAILFSANAFYIDSKNEFYFTGDPYAGLNYATYDKSRRMGVEVALEQYFFGGDLGFNESFTYLKAQKKEKGANDWTQVPYTYDYKATFGANVNVAGFFDIKFMQADLWMQNSFYGKQAVVSRTETGAVDTEFEKLNPYMISDVGVSFGFMKGAAIITAGVKNVFDTLYYDYYNHDKSASIGEYRYLLGQGRTLFVEGRFNY